MFRTEAVECSRPDLQLCFQQDTEGNRASRSSRSFHMALQASTILQEKLLDMRWTRSVCGMFCTQMQLTSNFIWVQDFRKRYWTGGGQSLTFQVVCIREQLTMNSVATVCLHQAWDRRWAKPHIGVVCARVQLTWTLISTSFLHQALDRRWTRRHNGIVCSRVQLTLSAE